jgi:hypothetical protein
MLDRPVGARIPFPYHASVVQLNPHPREDLAGQVPDQVVLARQRSAILSGVVRGAVEFLRAKEHRPELGAATASRREPRPEVRELRLKLRSLRRASDVGTVTVG